MKRSPLTSVLVAVGVVVVAVLLGAIVVKRSSGSSGGTQASFGPGARGGALRGNAPPGVDSAAMQKLRTCLQQNGVTPNGTRPARSTFQKAMQACAQYAPARRGGGFGPPPSQGSGATTT
jgi:hypothetical protein